VTLTGDLIEGEQTIELSVSGTVDQGSIELNGIVPVRWSTPPYFEHMKGLEHMRQGGPREGAFMLDATVTLSRLLAGGADETENVTLQIPVNIMAEVESPVLLG
jgi:hypothetical protein